ncbi:rhodanese-like domain-containing protein [Methanothrix harundinacea]|uniref:Rhodanese-like protein n=1 Tax=Methanothrix harundinacea (strain 6Ac) TaxID=1110509 RepID=G7WQI5_METH6|nr:rhodanese-like domain-containing protein [Methanothrix harundinacea]AET65538.1 Rhodanese-like protein [Methanothrix harundinacea 6Ac]
MSEGMVRDLDPREAIRLIQDGGGDPELLILDVRTPQEHERIRIEGSVNLDLHSPAFLAEVSALDRRKAYLVYCLVGVRSRAAAEAMARLGFGEVFNLAGGIRSWTKLGLPTVGR